jgi:hypothetical protein
MHRPPSTSDSPAPEGSHRCRGRGGERTLIRVGRRFESMTTSVDCRLCPSRSRGPTSSAGRVADYLPRNKGPSNTPNLTFGPSCAVAPSAVSTHPLRDGRTSSAMSDGYRRSTASSPPPCPGASRSSPASTAPASSTVSCRLPEQSMSPSERASRRAAGRVGDRRTRRAHAGSSVALLRVVVDHLAQPVPHGRAEFVAALEDLVDHAIEARRAPPGHGQRTRGLRSCCSRHADQSSGFSADSRFMSPDRVRGRRFRAWGWTPRLAATWRFVLGPLPRLPLTTAM